MSTTLIAIPARDLTALHIGCEIYIPRVNVMGVLSDLADSTLYVAGVQVRVRHEDRIVI